MTIGIAAATGCAPASFLVTPVSAQRGLVEDSVESDRFWAWGKIAIIEVDGVIQNVRSQSLFGPTGENPVSLFAEKLDKAARDCRVRAVVLRINSPGGGVAATDMMYHELRRFRARTGKPVVAAMQDVAASGGYYLACGCDAIYAQPTTVTGSIGVILMMPDLSGTMSKVGARVEVIKSGPMKDMGSLFRGLSDAEREVFQGLIDGMYTRFLDVVVEGRPAIDRATALRLADGRVYLAAEARRLGLIDEVGTLRDAVDDAKRRAGLANAATRIVRYGRPLDYRPNIYAQVPVTPAQVNIVNVELPDWLSGPAPQLLYLWAPGW